MEVTVMRSIALDQRVTRAVPHAIAFTKLFCGVACGASIRTGIYPHYRDAFREDTARLLETVLGAEWSADGEVDKNFKVDCLLPLGEQIFGTGHRLRIVIYFQADYHQAGLEIEHSRRYRGYEREAPYSMDLTFGIDVTAADYHLSLHEVDLIKSIDDWLESGVGHRVESALRRAIDTAFPLPDPLPTRATLHEFKPVVNELALIRGLGLERRLQPTS